MRTGPVARVSLALIVATCRTLWMLTWMFLAAIAIPEPFNECGVDEDSDLTCVSFRACG